MAGNRIFVNPEEVRNSASVISRYNEEIRSVLGEFRVEVESVDWEALGRISMKESFEAIRPEFERFYNYISRIVTFLNQNVADDVVTLDTAIESNGSELRSR